MDERKDFFAQQDMLGSLAHGPCAQLLLGYVWLCLADGRCCGGDLLRRVRFACAFRGTWARAVAQVHYLPSRDFSCIRIATIGKDLNVICQES